MVADYDWGMQALMDYSITRQIKLDIDSLLLIINNLWEVVGVIVDENPAHMTLMDRVMFTFFIHLRRSHIPICFEFKSNVS